MGGTMGRGGSRVQIARHAKQLATQRLAPLSAQLDAEHRFPTESFGVLAERGLLGITVPVEFGGLGADTLALTDALGEVAWACASTAVAMSVTNMVAETLWRFGSREVQERFIPEITSGRAVAGAFCLSEPGSGSDAASLTTTAVRDGDHYILNGTKAWITSGAHAGVFIVMARTSTDADVAAHRGISAFAVARDTPGLTTGKAEEKMGLLGSNTVSVILEDCRVPVSHLLATEGHGFKIAMTALDGGRITIGAMANGIARRALELAAVSLKSNGLGHRETHRHALGNAVARHRASVLMVERAAKLKVDAFRAESAGKAKTRFSREAAMAKLFATEACKNATSTSVSLVGRPGLGRRGVVERLMRDARVTCIFEGTSEIQKLVIGREVVSQYAGG